MLKEGRLDSARDVFSGYMADPDVRADAYRGLAAVAWRRGQGAGAVELLNEALRLDAASLAVRADLALLLTMTGRATEALEHWERVISASPSDAAALHNYGRCLMDLRRLDEAAAVFERAIAIDPQQEATFTNYAKALEASGAMEAAEDVWRRAIQAMPRNDAGYVGLGRLLFLVGRLDESFESYRSAVEKLPNSADLHMGYGQLLEDFGDLENAESEFRRALQLRPGWAYALEGILSLVKARARSTDVEAAQAILADDRATLHSRALVGYGLGKALDAQGRTDQAFEAWQAANLARQAMFGKMNRESWISRIEELQKSFSSDFIAERAGWGVDDPRPIFVVGMPRSGTTLVEQILSAHPDVHGYGELPEIPNLVSVLQERSRSMQSWPAAVGSLERADITGVAQRYLQSLRRRNPTRASRVVDKTPINFLHVGLIAILFPNARIISCIRDPRDVCLSIYAENFGDRQRYATDLADLAYYYRGYKVLMAHWHKVLGDRIYSCRYESLVSDPNEAAQNLVAATGLPWSESCLSFYSLDRPVLTPSRWQVRRPIYRDSVGRWKKYANHLAPLLDELDIEGVA